MKRPIPVGGIAFSLAGAFAPGERLQSPLGNEARCIGENRLTGGDNPRHAGFTLIEILMALALSLLLLGAVITMFGKVTESIGASRSLLEMADRLRLAEERLQLDLAGVTVTMNPPRDPANNEGYFEYIEGGTTTTALAKNTQVTPPVADQTVGQVGDILIFATHSTSQPFVGKFNGSPVQSDVAEVAWFVRGHTLHRRVLLVKPGLFASAPAKGFYAQNDISVHVSAAGTVATNTLGDLTRRECRFAHDLSGFPYSATIWGQLGLPTLAECSDANYDISNPPVGAIPATMKSTIDFWLNRTSTTTDSAPWADQVLYPNGTRVSDDIILTNVIGFDVKAWDPTFVDPVTGATGGYVDLGLANSRFSDPPIRHFVERQKSIDLGRVYDTWSTHYETVGTGISGDTPGNAVNGIDDNNNGIVDDDLEKLTSPPYPYPLRGIQVKIRVFEPDSKQIREVTVVQDFLPQ